VDVAVLEVGLGGRFDATNVVCDAYSSNIKTDVVLQAFMLSTKNAKPRINLKMYAVLIPKKLASLNLDAYFCNHLLEYESCNQVVTITELESNSVMS
jgi:hypothetical protein